MAKTTKVTAKKIMDKNNGAWIAPTTYDYVGFSVEVKPYINFSDAMKVIDELVTKCAPADGTAYYPQALDFAFRLNVIELFTNIEIPENIEDQYALVYGTDIYNRIDQDRVQVGHLRAIIDELSEYNTKNFGQRISSIVDDSLARIEGVIGTDEFKAVLATTNLNVTNS